jgi:hypothetical protein
MKLLTKAIERELAKHPLYSNENKKPEDVKVIVKFFCPWNQWTWYATEGSPTCPECGAYNCDAGHGPKSDFTFYGFVVGDDSEMGYFSLEELQSVRRPFGLGIERDIYYTPETLAALQAKHGGAA